MKVVELAFMAYPVTDLKRARRFYEGLLGMQQARLLGTEETGFVEDDIGPSTLSIGNGAPDWIPSPEGGSVGLEVDDFDRQSRSQIERVRVPTRTVGDAAMAHGRRARP